MTFSIMTRAVPAEAEYLVLIGRVWLWVRVRVRGLGLGVKG